VSLISILWNFAIEKLDQDKLGADPAHSIKRMHEGEREHEPWPPELIERFLNEARPSLRWAVKLALYTGQRRSDLVKVKWSQFWRDDKGRYWIDVCQQKTGAALSIPCHKELRMELESMPRVADTILIGDRGGPLEADSLSAAVRKQLRAIGVKGYVIHGLRKNAAVELINAGCSDPQVMAITGHKTADMVAHYSKKRDQRELASAAMEKWEQSGKPKNVAGK